MASQTAATSALYRVATTSSEMSEDMISNDSDNTFDDFSEEVTP